MIHDDDIQFTVCNVTLTNTPAIRHIHVNKLKNCCIRLVIYLNGTCFVYIFDATVTWIT